MSIHIGTSGWSYDHWQGVLYAQAWDELIELAELLDAPVMVTLEGKSAFPEDHPLALGTGGVVVTGPILHYLREADLIDARDALARWIDHARLTANPLYVDLPASVVLEITYTEPGLQGDRSTGGTKPATVETGATVNVPLFITTGEKIKVDTRDSSYLGRVTG